MPVPRLAPDAGSRCSSLSAFSLGPLRSSSRLWPVAGASSVPYTAPWLGADGFTRQLATMPKGTTRARATAAKAAAAALAPTLAVAAQSADTPPQPAVSAPLPKPRAKRVSKKEKEAAAAAAAAAAFSAASLDAGVGGAAVPSAQRAAPAATTAAAAAAAASAAVAAPPPALVTLEQLRRAAPSAAFDARFPGGTPRLWVVFSDLHVSDKSVATCLKVLQRVHEEARARSAGVIFLGDFWDARGDLPVEPLNSVLAEVKSWCRPTLMLVGNHDQVNLGGDSHALTPLAAASEWVHIFDVPALYLGALWLPYRRDGAPLLAAIRAVFSPALPPGPPTPAAATAAFETEAEGALSLPDGVASYGGAASLAAVPAASLAPAAAGGVTTIFCHADVVSAKQNSGRLATEGLLPAAFPRNIDVYTGHYHMPQTLPGTRITYVGSPYQVSMGEANESKRLLVLDAQAGWAVLEELPLRLGRQHYRARGGSLKAALSAQGIALEPGDRVKWSAPSLADLTTEMAAERQELIDMGVLVQMVSEAPARAPRMQSAEELSAAVLLERYADARTMSPVALALAQEALLEVQQRRGSTAIGPGSRPPVSVQFERVELEGYGPFRETQAYDLAGRGVRIVTGCNMDEAASDSNGSGKSCLVAAPWWALTGRLLSRSETGGASLRDPVGAMMNDDCKRGRVTLSGTVNGQAFTVERVITGAAPKVKTAKLVFHLDGEDLTQQEIKMTQARIDTTFNTNLLQQAAFYGQNDITALLEAGDKELKLLLAKVAEMEVWEEAREGFVKRERSKQRSAGDILQGTLAAHERLVAQREGELPGLAAKEAAWAEQWQHKMAELASSQAAHQSAAEAYAALAGRRGAALEHQRSTISAGVQRLQQELQALVAPLEYQPEAPASSSGRFPVSASPSNTDAELHALRQCAEFLDTEHRKLMRVEFQLKAQRDAKIQRLQSYQHGLSFHQHSESMPSAASRLARQASAGGGAVALLDAPTAAAAALAPVCEKCLQPVHQQQYIGNVAEMQVAVDAATTEWNAACNLCNDMERQARAASSALAGREQSQREELTQRIAAQQAEARRSEATRAERDRAGRAAEVAHRQQQDDLGKQLRSLQEQESWCAMSAQQLAAAVARWPLMLQRSAAVDPAGTGSAVTGGGSRGAVAGADRAALKQLCAEAQAPVAAADAALALARQVEAQRLGAQGQANPHSAELVSKRSELESLQEQVARLHAEASAGVRRLAQLEEADRALGRKGVPSFVLEGVLGELQELTAVYLEDLAEGMTLELSATTPGMEAPRPTSSGARRGRPPASAKDGAAAAATATAAGASDRDGDKDEIQKLVWVQRPDGSRVERSLLQLSGGERRRVALALALGFSQLVRQRGRLGCNLLVLDEVLQQLDSEGCRRVADVLRGLEHDTILLVGQAHSFVTDNFDAANLDVVCKSGGRSFVQA